MMIDIKEDLGAIVEATIGTRGARDLHADARACARTMEAALRTIQRRWPAAKSASVAEPIFILSAGWRSGSTFLQRLVASAEGVFIWGEPYRHSAIVESLAGQVRAFTEQWPREEFFIDQFENPDFTQQWVANLYPSLADFIAAHVAFFERIFARPALAFNAERWGFKGVTLTVDHACYLRWLFPRAKFIFLYRNPFHAYRSYYPFRDFYRTWPDRPVFTPAQFGEVWRDLTIDFIKGHSKVDGLLVRYEELHSAATRKRIEDYLGCAIADPDSISRISNINSNSTSHWAPKLHYWLLKRKVQPVASELGYRIA